VRSTLRDLTTDGDERWEVAKILEARIRYGSLWYMVQWKGYGPEHNKRVKHSDIFTKDTIDTYYRRHPNAPHQIALATFDSLSFQRHGRTICFICQDTVFQGGVMSGEPCSGRFSGHFSIHCSGCFYIHPSVCPFVCLSVHPIWDFVCLSVCSVLGSVWNFCLLVLARAM
jgi:hypothetical protein